MKLAIIGSRTVTDIDLRQYVGEDVSEIVSGGARGVDRCAAEYARAVGLKLTELLPEYDKYSRAAPIMRNKSIVEYADRVLAFWDGSSRGTLSVIKYAEELGKPCEVVLCKPN